MNSFVRRFLNIHRFALIFLLLFVGANDRIVAAESFKWDGKAKRVSANFRDWPLERVLTEIAVSTKWEVKIPEESGIVVSGTYKDLSPSLALKHMFGHLNYAVFSSPRGGKPRLQVFLPNPAGLDDDKKKAAAPKPVKRNTLARTSTGKPNYADVMKRFDKNGDGLISNDERVAARKALVPPGGAK